ncbi:MAG: transglutaminase-like cysteine peptidase [Caulobacteraceae bacterium]|nr:transglutaminase-like cysteine peptidase [Caulobacteraceae bacterium]
MAYLQPKVPSTDRPRTRGAVLAAFWIGIVAGALGGAYLAGSAARASDDRATVQRVLREVRAEVDWTRDGDGKDGWRVADGPQRGNCATMALTIAVRLERAGFAPQRLRILQLTGYGADTHAVLLVDGRWVADSQSPWVEPLGAYAAHPVARAWSIATVIDAAAKPQPWTVLAMSGDHP